jgi:hypothetical protein
MLWAIGQVLGTFQWERRPTAEPIHCSFTVTSVDAESCGEEKRRRDEQQRRCSHHWTTFNLAGRRH